MPATEKLPTLAPSELEIGKSYYALLRHPDHVVDTGEVPECIVHVTGEKGFANLQCPAFPYYSNPSSFRFIAEVPDVVTWLSASALREDIRNGACA